MSSLQKRFQDAVNAVNNGLPLEAERLFKKVLKTDPKNVPALNILTAILMSMERHAEAEEYISRAVRLNQKSDVSFYNYGLILKKLGKPQQALEQFNSALRLNARVPETWNNRGTVFNDLAQYENAISDFDQAISLAPNYWGAFSNKARSLGELGRHDEALLAYDKAIALKPDLVEAWLGGGHAFVRLGRYDQALAAYDKALALNPDLAEAWLGRGNAFYDLNRHDQALVAYDKTIALRPDLAEAWLGRGNALYSLKRHDEALAACDRALALKPDLAEAWLGGGNAFTGLKRYDEALAAYDKALALRPDMAEGWFGRGNVFYDLKRYDETLAACDKALALKPDLAEAWLVSGNAFTVLARHDEALAAYDKALALKPDLAGTEGGRLHAKMHLCDWTDFDAACANLISSVKTGKVAVPPFYLLGIASSSAEQLQCARQWVAENIAPPQEAAWQGQRYSHDRIRVGYVSADFRAHPVAFLMAGMLECHDKSRFEVTAISLGPDDQSEMSRRLRASFEHFIDAGTLSDGQIADLVKSSELDILVDLMGFTADSRIGIVAARAAPIQVNYLGYAGTMGAPHFDYILADRIVIPEERRECYSERVVYLPDSFMANDSARKISARAPRRSEHDLPETGFVFCSFNKSYKIVPGIFDSWMRLLRQVDGSVLWLSNTGETAIRNLRREAQTRGVDPGRLVFAKQVPLNEDHLARHRLANLFLDTLPYNAHATASDALWAGLPVLTCAGQTFAGRVAASLLLAVDLPELVAATQEAYERMALDLATHPDKLAAIGQRLAANRLTAPLFDTRLFTRQIEAAYAAMYRRHQDGLAPDHIVAPN